MYSTARTALVPLFLAVAASAADSAGGLPKRSPFELRDAPATPTATASETIEFAGVSSIVGKKTDLIFYDKTAKKSHWISKGETKEGISVVNYDERREEVVVKVNGVTKTLALRKQAAPTGAGRGVASVPAGFNTPLPAPAAGFGVAATGPVAQTPAANAPAAPTAPPIPVNAAQPATPPPAPGSAAEIQTRQETEARMLVSDLLEIGMAQRRAYEEAQRKAAEGGAQNANSQNAPATNTPQVVPAQPNP